MKTLVAIFLVVSVFGASFASATPIVEDNFNLYSDGSVVGQGGWESYVNGINFVIQGTTVFEGAKAIYNSGNSDNVIGKMGELLTAGLQSIYVRTENRNGWGSYEDGNVQVRMNRYLWSSPGTPPGDQAFTSLSFKKDGNVAYYNQDTGHYENFDIYEDNTWILVETEWRVDAMARYRVNGGVWTSWHTVPNSFAYVGFDYVGLEFEGRGGFGGVYFDVLGPSHTPDSAIPEPATIGFLAFGLLLLRRRKTSKRPFAYITNPEITSRGFLLNKNHLLIDAVF